MDFEDVLVRAEDVYHIKHSIWTAKYPISEWTSRRVFAEEICAHNSGQVWCLVFVTYDELRRDWSPQRVSYLMGILANAAFPRADSPQGITQALLSTMTASGAVRR